MQDDFIVFQAGEQRDGNAASPPLSVGDSRRLRRRAEGEAALGSGPTPNTLKSVKRARNLTGIQGRVSLLWYLGLRTVYRINSLTESYQ